MIGGRYVREEAGQVGESKPVHMREVCSSDMHGRHIHTAWTDRSVLKSKWRANSLTQLISNLIEPVRLVLVSYTRVLDCGFVVTSDLCVVLRVFLWGGHHFPPRHWPTNKHDFKARNLSDIVATLKSRWPYSLVINYRICPRWTSLNRLMLKIIYFFNNQTTELLNM